MVGYNRVQDVTGAVSVGYIGRCLERGRLKLIDTDRVDYMNVGALAKGLQEGQMLLGGTG